MDQGTVIQVEELRAALERVLDRVEERFGSTVDLTTDYYWTLDLRAGYDPQQDPGGSILAAQLSDDVHSIRELLRREDDPIIWHDLSHLVGVLRRIAALDLP
jgi:hypothetical protein